MSNVVHSPAGAENADAMGEIGGALDTGRLVARDGTCLGPAQRAAAVKTLRGSSAERPLDVLVIGGGVVGCGAALDAAARGLRVGLVEAGDLAVGTSSRSSRLAHGGLRYLEQGEIALVHEALTERGLLLDRLAPHLVRPVPFVFPVTSGVQRSYAGMGVHIYDLLSRIGAYGGTMPRPRTLSKAAMRGLAPGLKVEGTGGAVRFHDAQIDDARHTLALARTAAGLGAAVVTGVRVVDLIRVPVAAPEPAAAASGGGVADEAQASAATRRPEVRRPEVLLPEVRLPEVRLPEFRRPGHHHVDPGESGLRVAGAVLRDTSSGEELRVHARVVLSATGVWTDDLIAMATGQPLGTAVRRSKGIHLVVPRSAFRSSTAVIARTPHSVLFLLPWADHWLVGTTDTDYDGSREHPDVGIGDVEYLLGQANRWLAEPLTHEDVEGVFAGLRPLLSAGQGETTQLSREHAVMKPVPGFVAIAGGKYTTYRVMARDVVDAAVEQLPDEVEVAPCRTDELPLVGADGFRAAWSARVRTAAAAGMEVTAVERLLRRHGDRIDSVLELLDADPRLGDRLHPDGRVLRAEAIVAARDEGARSLADLLIRRTRLAVQTRDRAVSCARDAAALVAPILGWDQARIEQEVADLLAAQPEVPHRRS